MSDKGSENQRGEEETVDEFPPIDVNEIDKTVIGVDSATGESDAQSSGPSAEKTAAWIGRVLGKYQITGLLGQGGMGVVYQAHDSTIERDVAVKLLPAELASDKSVLDRFLAEAKAAGRLAHPHVVSIHEIGQHDEIYFIVMELMPGGSADDHLEKIGSYSPREATQVIADACEGLGVAHSSGLIHRDIKPANLLQSKHGTIKVADFGLAKGVIKQSQQLTQDGQLLGTPYFMSPEQCASKPVDNRSDIYSMGGTYYTLLTGEHPYDSAGSIVQIMYAHCHSEVLDPRDINSEIPEQCAEIIKKAMAKNPDDRYQTAEEMLIDLKAIIAESPKDHANSRLSEDHNRNHKQRSANQRWRVFPVILLLLAGVSFFIWNQKRQHGSAEKLPQHVQAQELAQGITSDKIILGTTTALSGSNKE
ncbi:serine/threonine-protein kinase, partial [uncultured Gimesia sp.]|uniref:serine/threonine protein kinase n=1 Tax=uncultured Gimesia sp. TaxID=1678688 RepID=UPI002638961F